MGVWRMFKRTVNWWIAGPAVIVAVVVVGGGIGWLGMVAGLSAFSIAVVSAVVCGLMASYILGALR